jgi:hypothetical protein
MAAFRPPVFVSLLATFRGETLVLSPARFVGERFISETIRREVSRVYWTLDLLDCMRGLRFQ